MNEQELQQQIMQLVQAAMSGDQQASQQIQQIIQAAQQGDQQAAQIAQMIQAVAQQMQQQGVQAAKFGAKLNYIKSLRGQCPEGTEMQLFKEGGRVCKKCVAKQKMMEGGEMPTDPIEAYKCGRKMKKAQNGAKTPHVAQEDTIHTTQGIRDLSGTTKYPKFDPKKATKQERFRASEKDYMAGRGDVQGPVKNTPPSQRKNK